MRATRRRQTAAEAAPASGDDPLGREIARMYLAAQEDRELHPEYAPAPAPAPTDGR